MQLPRQAKQMCDPMVHAWSELLDDPFEAPFQGVYMPLAEDNFPCPSMQVRNYAEDTIRGVTGEQCIVQCYSQAPMDPALSEGEETFIAPATFAGAISAYPFIVPNASTYGPSVAAAYQWAANNDTLNAASSLLTPIRFDSDQNPVLSLGTNQSNDYQLRTIAWGVRVSFISALQETEGWVEFIEPFEGQFSTTASGSFNGMRRTPSYRRRFFSDHRTHTFVWKPNCEAIKYAGIVPEAPASRNVPARSWLRIGGLKDGEEVMIEIMCTQELVARKYAGLSRPTHVSPDAIHVQNALASYPGGNGDMTANGRITKMTTLAHEVVAHKVASHPVLHKLAGLGGSYFAGKGLIDSAREYVAKEMPRALRAAGKVGLLAEEVEPLLLAAA